MRDGDGHVIGTHGFYIDITPAERARQDHLTAEVAKITQSRAAIEQAKGMLMAIYGIDAQAAFDLLKWRSQETNVKLRPLAEQIATDFIGAAHDEALPPRAVYDNLLLTAHHRIQQENNAPL